MTRLKFYDIGVNATDPQFHGIYRSKQKHDSDFARVHERSVEAGCSDWLITGGDLEDSRAAQKLAWTERHWYSTAGIHPTRSNLCKDYPGGLQAYVNGIKQLILEDKSRNDKRTIRAFGELGLDYDRLDWSSKEDQLPVFSAQLEIATELGLPLFLHSRACEEDFLQILGRYTPKLPLRGVVHSFTGTMNEMQKLTADGWSIGINGCSLKTEENLKVVKDIPLHLLMLETDSPWCDVRPSHAGHHFLKMEGAPVLPESKKVERFEMGKMVRSRNEPCTIQHVAWIVAQVKGMPYAELASRAYQNTCAMFGTGKGA